MARNYDEVRDCVACGEPCPAPHMRWCSDYCWRMEDGGWDDYPPEPEPVGPDRW